MADTKPDYSKPKKRPFYLALGGDRKRVVRIVAKDVEEAKRLSDKIDPRTATLVALDEQGNLLRRGDDAVMEMTNGQRMLVGQGYSTADPDRIAQFASGMSTADLSKQMMQQSLLKEEPAGALGSVMLSAAGFGLGSWADELVDKVFGGNTKAYIDAMRTAMEDQRPLQTFLVQAGVGMTEAGAILKQFPQLAKVFGGDEAVSGLVNVMKAGGTGALSASIPAAIQAAGDAPEGQRGSDALKAGVTGLVTGGIVGAAAPSVSAGASRVMEAIKKSEVGQLAAQLGISRTAAIVIKNAFNEGGNIQTAMDNIKKAGDAGMLADAGIAARALADAVSQAGGEPAETVARNIQDRAAQTSANLQSTLMDTVGSPLIGPKAAVEKIAKRTEKARTEAYRIAYNTPIDYSTGGAGEAILEAVSRIDDDLLRQAVKKANARMRADGIKNQQVRIKLDDDGNVIDVSEDLNVMQLDYLKRGLQNLAEDNRDRDTLQLNSDGQLFADLARQLRQAMSSGIVDADGNRVYDAAVQLGGDKIAEQNAFKLGRDLLKPKTKLEDVFQTLGEDPSEAQSEALKMGMAQHIREILDDVKAVPSDPNIEARQLDAFYRLTSSESARNKIRQVLGGDAAMFLKQIDEVAQTALVRAQIGGNSATAIRQSIQKGVEDQTGLGPASMLLRGEPLAASREIVKGLTGMTDQFTEKRRQAIYNDIAKALTQVRSRDAREALAILRRVQLGREASQEERDFLANRIAYYMGSATQKQTEQQALEATGQTPVTGMPRTGLGLLVQ